MSNQKIYTVFKEGIYRHDLMLAGTNKQRAIDHADELSRTDADNYHAYSVIESECDVPLPKSMSDSAGYLSWKSQENQIYITDSTSNG